MYAVVHVTCLIAEKNGLEVRNDRVLQYISTNLDLAPYTLQTSFTTGAAHLYFLSGYPTVYKIASGTKGWMV